LDSAVDGGSADREHEWFLASCWWPVSTSVVQPAHKREHLVAYEDANSRGEGGAYLRRNGLYSSLISEWRRLRDAGMLDGKEPGVPVGRPTSEQAEIARLRRRAEDAERKLATTEIALAIMGKV